MEGIKDHQGSMKKKDNCLLFPHFIKKISELSVRLHRFQNIQFKSSDRSKSGDVTATKWSWCDKKLAFSIGYKVGLNYYPWNT